MSPCFVFVRFITGLNTPRGVLRLLDLHYKELHCYTYPIFGSVFLILCDFAEAILRK